MRRKFGVHPSLLLLLASIALLSYPTPHLRAADSWNSTRVSPAQPIPAEPQQFAGYLSVTDVEHRMREQAERYPELATFVAIGDSWERTQNGATAGHTIWSLQITSSRYPAPKPVFTMIAAMHANELPTTELALRFIDLLLSGYGTDADITWLVDEHTIIVVPILNPDARSLPFPTRKTTAATSDPNCRGIDLNRNFPYAWGGIGSSDLPCAVTYRGAAAASEPETQAAMRILRTWYPERLLLDATAHPDTTDGILLSLHTSGALILYPWAHTAEPAPNADSLSLLAAQLARSSGYRPIPAHELYPHSGRLDDWAYAELGIAAFTFEIGRMGHAPPFEMVDSTLWPENREAFLDALRVTRAPYRLPHGPMLGPISVEAQEDGVEIRVELDSSTLADSVILYLGAPPWRNGMPITLEAVDGNLDSLNEPMRTFISRELLAANGAERQAFYIQAYSTDTTPGPLQAVWSDPANPRFTLALPLLMHR